MAEPQGYIFERLVLWASLYFECRLKKYVIKALHEPFLQYNFPAFPVVESGALLLVKSYPLTSLHINVDSSRTHTHTQTRNHLCIRGHTPIYYLLFTYIRWGYIGNPSAMHADSSAYVKGPHDGTAVLRKRSTASEPCTEATAPQMWAGLHHGLPHNRPFQAPPGALLFPEI